MRTLRLAALLSLSLPLAAQEWPAGWVVRFDRPNRDSIEVVTMAPGWHITAHDRAILYNPATTAQGSFTAEALFSLFPSPPREGFGLIFGGRRLADDDQDYLYFLVRGDGHFLVKHRAGAETQVITDWTRHAAVPVHPGEGSPDYHLGLRVADGVAHFLVNDVEVHTLELPAYANTDGIVGLRVNHHVDVHVHYLNVH